MRTFLAFALIGLPTVVLGETWPRHVIDNASKGADGVKLGDVNEDGRPDIATGWEEGGVICVYLNPGPLKSKDRWPAVTVGRVGNPEDATFADVDHDGDLDVVSCCEGKTQAIFFHVLKDTEHPLDEASWTTERVPAADGRMWMQCTPIALNDGRTGLIVGSKGENGVVATLLPPANTHPDWTLMRIADAGWVMSIERAGWPNMPDFMLVSDRKGSRRGVSAITMNEGTDVAARVRSHSDLGGRNHEVMFLATSENSRSVFAATSKGPILWLRIPQHEMLGGPSKWFPKRVTGPRDEALIAMPPNTGTGKAVAIGDLNGDDVDDIAVTCENAKGKVGVFWLERQMKLEKDSEWAFHDISGPEGTKFDRIELFDLDADGDLDLLTCEERENLGVIWYENPLK